MAIKIGEIYNSLLDFESKSKKGRGEQVLYPIHKKLQFSDEKYNDISDWIIDNFPINKGDFILDAGCGTGYVLTKICSNLDCYGLGISLSQKEIEYASVKTVEPGPEYRVTFEQKSFDEQFDNQFDFIIAIESLKHSHSVQNTIENLFAHLKPGGRIFILDDFETDSKFQFLKKQIGKLWAVDSFFPLSSITEKLSELKSTFKVFDFTSNVEYSGKKFTGLKVFVGYLLQPVARLLGVYKIYSIFFAGLCLERLYKKRALEYKAVIAEKN